MEHVAEAASHVADLATEHPYAATAVAAVAAVAALRRGRGRTAERKPRLRASSIGTTRLMVSGSYDVANYDTIINIVVGAERMPSVEAFLARWDAVALPHQRFHCVPYQEAPLAPVQWIAKKVCSRDHVTEHSVSADAVARKVDEIANTILADKVTRPWWELHFIRVHGSDDGAGRIVMRIHHSLGDGISLTEAIGPLMDLSADGAPLDVDALFAPARAAMGRRTRRNVVSRIFRGAWLGFDFVRSAVQQVGYAMVGGDTTTEFHDYRRAVPIRNEHVTVYFPPHQLEVIKAIKTKAGNGTTVNDVCFALYAGTVRRFLEKHDPHCNLDTVQMRALTPFAVPEAACEETRYSTVLRNVWTFLVNELPVKQRDPAERLRASHSTWQRIKEGAVVPACFFVHRNIGGRAPLSIQRKTATDLASRMTTVFSNVPGPQQPTFIAGQRITSINMVFPNLIPQVGILSLAGKVHMCLSIVRHPQIDLATVLPQFFAQELAATCAAFNVDGSRAFN